MVTPEQLVARSQEDQRRATSAPHHGESQLSRWVEIAVMVERQAQEWVKQEAAISRDTRLSDQGRREAMAAHAQKAVPETKWLGDKRNQIIETIARLRALCLDFMERPKGADLTEAYFRERELRDGLRGRPQVERDGAFLRAAERLDRETMRALLDAPGAEPWVSEEARRRGETSYGQRKNAEVWARVQDLEVLLDHVSGLADHVGQVLLTMGGEPSAIKKALGIQTESAHA